MRRSGEWERTNGLLKSQHWLQFGLIVTSHMAFVVSFFFHANETRFTSTLDYCNVHCVLGNFVLVAVTGHGLQLLEDGKAVAPGEKSTMAIVGDAIER